jgi:UDP-N-acetylglucosamine 3-dehydrogenase
MVAQSQRFRPGVQTVKSGFDDGKLGEPGLVRIHRWVPRPGGARADEDPGLTFLPMVDDIDLACWLFGHGPATLLATGNRGAAPAGGCDCLQLHLGFPGDGMALIESGALPRGDGYFSLTAIGSKGAAYADDHENMQLLYRGGHPTALRTGEGDHQLLLQLEAFVTAIDKGREPPVRGEDAAQVLRVAEAAAASLARGVAMRLDNGRWRPEGEGT